MGPISSLSFRLHLCICLSPRLSGRVIIAPPPFVHRWGLTLLPQCSPLSIHWLPLGGPVYPALTLHWFDCIPSMVGRAFSRSSLLLRHSRLTHVSWDWFQLRSGAPLAAPIYAISTSSTSVCPPGHSRRFFLKWLNSTPVSQTGRLSAPMHRYLLQPEKGELRFSPFTVSPGFGPQIQLGMALFHHSFLTLNVLNVAIILAGVGELPNVVYPTAPSCSSLCLIFLSTPCTKSCAVGNAYMSHWALPCTLSAFRIKLRLGKLAHAAC